MCHRFKQRLISNGWQFKRNGKGSHQLWSHPEKGTVSISLKAMKQQISRTVEKQLFGI
ncbi:hypothetical protein LEP3755_30550 [Leptolyngbya sp. NIES-3755]|nr:hypothetical protein LEP3755_30550 [Leptolyngbya sp. NIES-3755]